MASASGRPRCSASAPRPSTTGCASTASAKSTAAVSGILPGRNEGDFRALAENLPGVVARLDGTLALLYVNRAAREEFGAAPWPWWPALRAATARVFETHRAQSWHFEAPVGGETRLHAGRVVPELDGASFRTVVAVAVESPAAAFDPAAVSHALRTPLNAIQSWAHVLEGALGNADPNVRRALAGILLGVTDQVALIEELVRAKPPSPDGSDR